MLAVPLTAAAQDTQQRTAPPTRYTVTDLGTLPGGNFSQPFFINRYGLVSGSSSLPDGTQHAILWLDGLTGDIGAATRSTSERKMRNSLAPSTRAPHSRAVRAPALRAAGALRRRAAAG